MSTVPFACAGSFTAAVFQDDDESVKEHWALLVAGSSGWGTLRARAYPHSSFEARYCPLRSFSLRPPMSAYRSGRDHDSSKKGPRIHVTYPTKPWKLRTRVTHPAVVHLLSHLNARPLAVHNSRSAGTAQLQAAREAWAHVVNDCQAKPALALAASLCQHHHELVVAVLLPWDPSSWMPTTRPHASPSKHAQP